jgi:hypothetical protein
MAKKQKKQATPRETATGCLVVIVIAVIIAIVVAVSGGGKSQTPKQQAAAYIKSANQDLGTVQASVQTVLITMGLAIKSSTQSNVDQLAQSAQTAHDTVDNTCNDMATKGSIGSSGLPGAETDLFGACQELRDAMSAIVGYTGNPNPATLAQLNTKFTTGRSDWNEAVRSIYQTAGESHPPTI